MSSSGVHCWKIWSVTEPWERDKRRDFFSGLDLPGVGAGSPGRAVVGWGTISRGPAEGKMGVQWGRENELEPVGINGARIWLLLPPGLPSSVMG